MTEMSTEALGLRFDVDKEALGLRIVIARRRQHVSQKELANLCKRSQQTISAYEMGKRLPRVDMLLIIARILHVSTDWLIYGKKTEGKA